jgi:hypothetical protein
MSKRTEVAVLAFSGAVDVRSAKLRFVLVWMVELLNSIVSFLTTLTLVTFSSL